MMSIFFAFFLLIISIFVAWAGGHLFIQGVNVVSRLFRLSGLTAGLLIASISTSSPELFVGVSSALRKLPEISLGNILGSNIVNIALTFGIFLILSSRRLSKDDIRTKDILIACAAPLLILILSLDGMLSKLDGIILLFLFALWVRWLVMQKIVLRETKQEQPGKFLHFAIGLSMLVVAGYAFTESAGALANIFGVNLFLLSSIVVAFGTSMPELTTSIIALRTKQSALAVGNLLGSNVFNSLGILGLVALIQPFAVSPQIIALPVAFAVTATLLSFLSRNINSLIVGALLVSVYVLYLLANALMLNY
jgi:cation:H+ antiporter